MKRYFVSILLIISFASFKKASGQKVEIIKDEYIFNEVPFKACHASTLIKLGPNRLLASWFGGTQESNPDVCIWTAENDGTKWSSPIKVADGIQPDGKRYACWNPVLFIAANGVLYLHYKIGPNPREWWAMYKTSKDGGKTWSSAVALPKGFLGPIKNKPVQLANGDILYPSSTESLDEKTWQIHLERSDAALKKWEKINIDCDTFQLIQPSILRYSKQRLQLLSRSKQNVIAQNWSNDNGKTWSKATATQLPNPNSGSDAVTVNGYQLLVYNPLTAGKNWWEGRSVLKLAVTKDGEHWKDLYTFEQHDKGEYSYPAIIADTVGNVYVTYTHDRSRIKFVQLKFFR
ncbi:MULTISPECIES: sialidase family protein [unclassified Mucilaginibacter]|uniref:sialidase family protein n=1 Tax=unclassified Mucilaginibacter TaxID=2617802 RepID=UPI0009615B82|nr:MULTISPECIES: sialidase family protein [unclassified Mucilaginibacter]OJW12906.1 MAG: sialidase [Mucilaginibacter sp. 44-25]PLW91594.1 MAG: sialidase [Mucilaginibacter sp.]HEK20756.1 sialidase [Bacteroidota bacterium]